MCDQLIHEDIVPWVLRRWGHDGAVQIRARHLVRGGDRTEERSSCPANERLVITEAEHVQLIYEATRDQILTVAFGGGQPAALMPVEGNEWASNE